MKREYGISLYFRDTSSILEEIVNEIYQHSPDYVLVDDETPPNEDCFLLLYRLVSSLTNKITFGTSITNPFSRHPLSLVFNVLSMIKHFNIHFLLGIGNGSNSRREALGIKSKEYLLEMKETINIIKNLFETGLVDFDGKYFRCHSSVPENLKTQKIPKILLAARGYKMLDLSTELADGVFGVYYPFQEYIDYFKLAIINGLQNRRKNFEDFNCALWVPIYINPSSDDKQKITYHCKKRWEITPHSIKKLINSKEKKSSDFLNKLVVQGDINDCVDQLKKWREHISVIPFFAINESNYYPGILGDLNKIIEKI